MNLTQYLSLVSQLVCIIRDQTTVDLTRPLLFISVIIIRRRWTKSLHRIFFFASHVCLCSPFVMCFVSFYWSFIIFCLIKMIKSARRSPSCGGRWGYRAHALSWFDDLPALAGDCEPAKWHSLTAKRVIFPGCRGSVSVQGHHWRRRSRGMMDDDVWLTRTPSTSSSRLY